MADPTPGCPDSPGDSRRQTAILTTAAFLTDVIDIHQPGQRSAAARRPATRRQQLPPIVGDGTAEPSGESPHSQMRSLARR